MRALRTTRTLLQGVLLVLAWACRVEPPVPAAARDANPISPVSAGAASEVETAPPTVRAGALRAHMAFLADDLLESRGTGARGYRLAARYVAAQFEALGLEPAGGAESYEQPVPFLRADLVAQASRIALRKGGRERVLGEAEAFLNPLFTRTLSEVTAPAVFVGFGVSAPELGYDDYAGLDVRGKIVAYLRGGPPSFPPTQRAHHAAPRTKLGAAIERGAVGVLSLRTPADEQNPWEWMVRQLRVGALRWVEPDGTPHDGFPEIRGSALLSRAGAEALFAGASPFLAAVHAAAATGRPPAFALPVEVSMRTTSRHTQLQSSNVAGLLRGSDPARAREVVVYTAHLDHLGIGAPTEGDSIYNGALDNASGSATLVEIARAFRALPEPPRRSVMFLAVTGEEKGLLGSDYFASFPTVPIETIVANVNVDGLGLMFPLRSVVALGGEHSTLGASVQRAAARLGLAVVPDPAPEEVFFVRSDQYSFVQKGIPAISVFMGFDRGSPEEKAFRNWIAQRYHTPADDMRQPLDLESAVRHAQVNFLVGLEVAQADAPPAWNPDDFFGKTFGRARSAAD